MSITTSGDKAVQIHLKWFCRVRTWTGTTEIAKDVQMTVAGEDGTVTTTANFYQADVNPPVNSND